MERKAGFLDGSSETLLIRDGWRCCTAADVLGEAVPVAGLREVPLSQEDKSGGHHPDWLGHSPVHYFSHPGHRSPASGQVGLVPSFF